MHIPDGYLSPQTCGVMYATAVPFWAVAVTRVRKIIGGRTVPLLAIFSAFSFAIMMFNVPVPGGTTAHGVGGTLTAIVLGPWAAVISTSVALIIQALFFGDGGITAIGANCMNMGVILPISGFLVYKLMAGRSGPLTQRRIIAAAIGSYVGITLAALAVGIELGVQPHFWSTNGIPDYSPYGLSTAIPAMLLAHMLGASFVEAAITALGLAYMQKSYPEILMRGQKPAADLQDRARRFNPWVVVSALAAVSAGVIFVAGLVKGDGDLSRWAGLNWSTVKGSDVLETVLVSAAVSAVVLPLLFVALRRAPAWRTPALVFVGILIWVPIGLIAPGGAFGEDQTATQAEVSAAVAARQTGDNHLFEALPAVNRECACVPTNLANVTFSKHTLFEGYQPPWVRSTDSPWRQNLGYQFAGVAGMGALLAIGFALYRFGRWLIPPPPPDWRTAGD